MEEELKRSRRWCREVARKHARSFYFASWPLPEEKRSGAYAVYAFCRHVDDMVDEGEGGVEAGEMEVELRGLLDEVLGGRSGLPFAPAFIEAFGRFGLERRPFLELVEGVVMDVGYVRMADWAELENYCYHVASTVGLVLCPLFGLAGERGRVHAIELGMAMQLTNILRDIGEDLARGRIYLPADELDRHGLAEEDLRRGVVDERWRAFMIEQISRAREMYERSQAGISMLADDGSQLTVWLMRVIYADILYQIERLDYDVFGSRAHVGTLRKCYLAVRAWYMSWRNRSRATNSQKHGKPR